MFELSIIKKAFERLGANSLSNRRYVLNISEQLTHSRNINKADVHNIRAHALNLSETWYHWICNCQVFNEDGLRVETYDWSCFSHILYLIEVVVFIVNLEAFNASFNASNEARINILNIYKPVIINERLLDAIFIEVHLKVDIRYSRTVHVLNRIIFENKAGVDWSLTFERKVLIAYRCFCVRPRDVSKVCISDSHIDWVLSIKHWAVASLIQSLKSAVIHVEIVCNPLILI